MVYFGFNTFLFEGLEVSVSCSFDDREDEIYIDHVASVKTGEEVYLDDTYFKDKDGSFTSMLSQLEDLAWDEWERTASMVMV